MPSSLPEFNCTFLEATKHALTSGWLREARPNQLPPPGDWSVWLILAGRGWGKTRTGAEWVRAQVRAGCGRLALIAATAADARDVMVEGESGILAISSPSDRPDYEPSKRRLTWPNGAQATVFSADEPDRLRGPQFAAAWADEVAAWREPDAWDQLQFGLRLGKNPRTVVTTTPRPVKLIRSLVARAAAGGDVVITRGSTYENRANMAQTFFSQIVSRYEGTRLGRQELEAELLTDTPGALWRLEEIDLARVALADVPPLKRIVVAVDPPTTSNESSDECGIIVGGLGADGHGYVLEDCSRRGTPAEWASESVRAYHRHGADRLVAEVNQGGEMVEATVRQVDPNVSYEAVRASRGKVLRAEPVAALYEQKRVHHVASLQSSKIR